MALDVRPHRFSIEQYERMVSTGVLTEDDRVELIAGEIVEMVPPSPEHSTVVTRLNRLFLRSLDDRAVVRVQDAVRLPPESEPEPDLALAQPPDSRYSRRHPEPAELFLVVEVAYSTQSYDRRMKIPLYALQGISEVWLIDVPAAALEVYRSPGPEGYATVEIFERGVAVSPTAFPDVRITLDDLLP
jgi:Uma2 family endonuclease